MSWRLSILLVLLVFAPAVLCGLLGSNWISETLFYLVAGWIFYLVRVIPEIVASWGGAITCVVCSLLLVAGLHPFLRWLMASKRNQTATQLEPWRLRWTLSLLAVTVLMFISGISAVGVIHQSAWLLNSPEPLVEGGIRSVAARTQSGSNLRQMGLAVLNYHDQKGTTPPGALVDSQGHLLHGWQTMLLPYMEQESLFKQVHLDVAWSHPSNSVPFQTHIREYCQPQVYETKDAQGYALTHYAGNVRVLGGAVGRKIPTDFPDGTSNTLLAGEAAGNFKPWGHPANWRDPALGLNTTPNGFGSPGRNLVMFVFADGSTRSISDKVSPMVLNGLSTPDGSAANK